MFFAEVEEGIAELVKLKGCMKNDDDWKGSLAADADWEDVKAKAATSMFHRDQEGITLQITGASHLSKAARKLTAERIEGLDFTKELEERHAVME